MSRRPAVMSWSSGKDATMALHRTREAGALEVSALFATFNAAADRVAIHGTRRAVARAQAAALDLPLVEVDLPDPCPNAEYEARVGAAAERLRTQGIEDWVFGDLYLQDIRDYREAQLQAHGLRAHFPLWGDDTRELALDMLAAGIEAHVVTLDPRKVPRALCGGRFDRDFLDRLDETVDPCGERGEFHTLVAHGPGFSKPLRLVRGETVERGGFVYADFTLEQT